MSSGYPWEPLFVQFPSNYDDNKMILEQNTLKNECLGPHSDMDLTLKPKTLDENNLSNNPWIQNTFFHFPTDCGSTEFQGPSSRQLLDSTPLTTFDYTQPNKHSECSSVPSHRSLKKSSSYGSSLSLNDIDWPSIPLALSWLNSNYKSPYDKTPTETNFLPPDSILTNNPPHTTFEALDQFCTTEENTDTMLKTFLHNLSQGIQSKSTCPILQSSQNLGRKLTDTEMYSQPLKTDNFEDPLLMNIQNTSFSYNPQNILDPQLQAQDALLNYYNNLFQSQNFDYDMFSAEGVKQERSGNNTIPEISTSETALSQWTVPDDSVNYSATLPSLNISALYLASNPVSQHVASPYIKESLSNKSPGDSKLHSCEALNPSYYETSIKSCESVVTKSPETKKKCSTNGSLKLFSCVHLDKPQHVPPKDLVNMSLLYQRSDVKLRHLKLSEKNSKEGQSSGEADESKLPGNEAHPHSCKPCAFYWTKGCINGKGCQFCHEQHAPKKKKPMKDQKNLMIIARPDGKLEFLRCSVDEALRRS